MLLGTQQAVQQMGQVSVKVDNTCLERVTSYKYLGVKLDAHLKFDEHVLYIKQKTFSKIKLLGRLKWVLDRDTLLLLYKTLIVPIIEYGDHVYHGMTQGDAYTLQKLQNTACRSILRADMRTSIADMHEELNVHMLHQRCCQHKATMVYKFLHGLGPESCKNLLVLVSSTHNVATRSSDNFVLLVPQTRLVLTDNDFAVVGPKLWNQLPLHIKTSGSLDI